VPITKFYSISLIVSHLHCLIGLKLSNNQHEKEPELDTYRFIDRCDQASKVYFKLHPFIHRAVSLTITHIRARFDNVYDATIAAIAHTAGMEQCENYKIIREQIIIYRNEIILQR